MGAAAALLWRRRPASRRLPAHRARPRVGPFPGARVKAPEGGQATLIAPGNPPGQRAAAALAWRRRLAMSVIGQPPERGFSSTETCLGGPHGLRRTRPTSETPPVAPFSRRSRRAPRLGGISQTGRPSPAAEGHSPALAGQRAYGSRCPHTVNATDGFCRSAREQDSIYDALHRSWMLAERARPWWRGLDTQDSARASG
jgi:hypothetical protein